MHDVRVRSARASDAAALALLAEELGYPATAGEMAERLLALEHSPDDAVLVAVLGEGAVAWIHVAIVSLVEAPRLAEIRGLAVTSALRSRGIGEQLVRRAEDWARARGVSRIRVRSNVVRERTHAFYERLGYTVTKSQKVFDKNF